MASLLCVRMTNTTMIHHQPRPPQSAKAWGNTMSNLTYYVSREKPNENEDSHLCTAPLTGCGRMRSAVWHACKGNRATRQQKSWRKRMMREVSSAVSSQVEPMEKSPVSPPVSVYGVSTVSGTRRPHQLAHSLPTQSKVPCLTVRALAWALESFAWCFSAPFFQTLAASDTRGRSASFPSRCPRLPGTAISVDGFSGLQHDSSPNDRLPRVKAGVFE